MTRDQLVVAFLGPHGPERAADEVLRLRNALRQAGEIGSDAKAIAEAALAIWPGADEFQRVVNRQPPPR